MFGALAFAQWAIKFVGYLDCSHVSGLLLGAQLQSVVVGGE